MKNKIPLELECINSSELLALAECEDLTHAVR